MNYLFLSPRGPALFPRPSFRWSGVGLESVPFGSGLTARFIDLKKLTLEHSFINDSCTTSLSIVILSMFSAFPFFSAEKRCKITTFFSFRQIFGKLFFEFVFPCRGLFRGRSRQRHRSVVFRLRVQNYNVFTSRPNIFTGILVVKRVNDS